MSTTSLESDSITSFTTTTTISTPTNAVTSPIQFCSLIPFSVIFMGGILVPLIIINIFLASFRVYQDAVISKSIGTYRHWLGLMGVFWVAVYNFSFIYLANNPSEIISNRIMYLFLIVSSVCAGASLNIMSLLKYMAIVPPNSRRRFEVGCWIGQMFHFGLVLWFGINDTLKSVKLPTAYGDAFTYSLVAFVLEPVLFGLGFFGFRVKKKINEIKSSNQESGLKMTRLVNATNLFTLINAAAWLGVFLSVLLQRGKPYNTPTNCILFNIIAFTEIGGDMITKVYVQMATGSQSQPQKSSWKNSESPNKAGESQAHPYGKYIASQNMSNH